jgi:hypothetical protein
MPVDRDSSSADTSGFDSGLSAGLSAAGLSGSPEAEWSLCSLSTITM